MSDAERRLSDIRANLESLRADFNALERFRLTEDERSSIRENISRCYEELGKLLDQLDRDPA